MIGDIHLDYSTMGPMISKDGISKNLSLAESKIIQENSESDLIDLLVYHGIDLNLKSTNITEQSRSIRSNLPTESLLCMLDTQTVFNAQKCLEGEISPLNLIDLATFTAATIYFDNVVIQPNNRCSIVEEKPDLFSVIKYPNNHFVEDTLWGMLDRQYLDEKKYADEWCNFFNFPQGEINLDLYCYKGPYQNSPHYWDGIFATYYVDSLLRQDQLLDRGSNNNRDEFLSIQTMRTIFNDRLAGFIGIPYYASSLKSCIHSKILENKMERRMIIDKLIYEIEPKNDNSGSNFPYITEYSAPFLLGLILERMKNPDDYWDILKEYKEKFSPLRKKIVQDKNQWEGRSGIYLNNYVKYIQDFMNDIETPTQKSVVKGGALVGTTFPVVTPLDKVALDLGIKLIDLFVHNKSIRKLYLRKFRPEVYLLINLSEEAKQLHSVENRIQNIWGSSWSRREQDQLLNLTKTNPYNFSKLINVG